jgi:rhodanese-related sulfurtransferase
MDTATPPAPSFSAQDLFARLGRIDAPLIVDVRKTEAFDSASCTLPGALRLAPDTFGEAIHLLPRDRLIVVYCGNGQEVSQAVARALVAVGLDARYLQDGISGWEHRGLPTITTVPELGLPATPGHGTRWVTRERPKIDRIACPWLIRRFIDPLAEFLYVPAEQVIEAGAREKAIPYDVAEVRFSHAEGELCSFDAFLREFHLDEPCLAELARIVRGADTGKPELTPQSPGLLAISLGLSLNFPDDHVMLEEGMVIYDALYAWLKSTRTRGVKRRLCKKI